MLSKNNSNHQLRGWHIAALFGTLALLLGIGLTAGGAFASRPSEEAGRPVARPANPGGTDIVISQVYGGGGNTGAPLQNDFIELFNPTANPISIVGWSVQYASAAGTSWAVTAITGSIPAGGYYLVQEAAGNACGGLPCGVVLPTPDAIGTIAMSGTNAKIALTNTTTALTGGCPTGGALVDFVGYGTANCFEGAGAVAALSNTTSAIRKSGGCQDNDNNSGDFDVLAPTPRNSASPTNSCVGTPTVTPTAIPTCGPGSDYAIFATTGATMVPGVTDTGNHCSSCTTNVALPFTYNLYNVPYTSVDVSPNGNMQFSSSSGAFTNTCLPAGTFNNAILGFWDGLDTTAGITTTITPGIYTSISGSSPNRIFNVEWRTCIFNSGVCDRGIVNFEVRLYEGQDRFDVVYDRVDTNGDFATIGVQRGTGSSYSQYSCDLAVITQGLQLEFRPYTCGELTQTPTITLTRTSTNTPSPTRTPTSTGTPTITPGGPTLTPTDTATPTATHPTSNSVVISEFRTRGSLGGNDEFIELYNKTGSPIDISGWKINASSSCAITVSTRLIITSGVTIPAYGHFLATNSLGYTGTVTGDATYSTGVSDDGGIGLLDASNIVIDSVGMCITTTFHEGTPLSPTITNTNQSQERLLGGLAGNAVDTNNNLNDFFLNPSSSNPQNLSDPPVPPCTSSTEQNSISGFVFNPASMTIYQGDTVNWTNLDGAPHTSTSDTAVWDSGGLVQNDQFSFTFNAPGVYPYHCDIHPSMLGTITVLAGCAPSVTATPTATATPPAAILVGHVTWQGIPQNNSRSILPITLTLKLPGGVEVNYPQQNTDAAGFFTVSVAGMPNGTYNWRVQSPDGVNGGNLAAAFIANCGTVALAGAPQTDAEMGTMRGGDADNNNIVNASDFNILKTDFGQAGVRRGDFDNSLVVNASDFNIQKGNFGQGGCGAVLSPRALSR